jgi:hypothetical protein
MTGPHNKIIAAAAKAELAPLGFKRQGQSRLWIKDHGFWLNVVGFKPSRWSVTVDLDNAAHWIWGGAGFMSLNYIMSGGPYTEFEDEDQFGAAVSDIARSAAAKAQEIDSKFESFEAIAQYVIAEANESERMCPSWFGYYAGVASGISGDLLEAERFLRNITDERVIPRAGRFLSAINTSSAFREQANDIVTEQRAALKLPPLAQRPF